MSDAADAASTSSVDFPLPATPADHQRTAGRASGRFEQGGDPRPFRIPARPTPEDGTEP
jgi:hypothetical protein